MNRIERKIQKFIDRATNLEVDMDEFIRNHVVPRLPYKFKNPHNIGRYFVATEILGGSNEQNPPCLVGNVLVGITEYRRLCGLNVFEREHLLYVLRAEGFFDKK